MNIFSKLKLAHRIPLTIKLALQCHAIPSNVETSCLLLIAYYDLNFSYKIEYKI